MRLVLIETIRQASIRKRLWLGAGAVAVFIGTLLVSLVLTPSDPKNEGKVGLDFIAFYTAGRFVREGRSHDLYNIHQVSLFQKELARENGVELGTAVGPWWNPPFYAWTFVPLARLDYPTAIRVWVGFNLLCAMGAAAILCRWIARAGGASPWSWLLVPALMALSTPFIQSLSHGQNTGTSLLIIAAAVVCWRSGRALAAGLVTGLMLYKPQLAAVLSTVLILDLGWRAAAGFALTAGALLLACLALPGSIGDFLHLMPRNLHFVQCETPYLWDRHVTFKAFWRLLFQGYPAGEPLPIVTILSGLCSAGVGIGLLRAIFVGRGQTVGPARSVRRDRVIAAAIASTPLLMPFYFDYDQLLLAIAACLFAVDLLRRDPARPLPRVDRWLLRLWPAQYVWMMLNPDIASATHVNLGVLLLSAVCGLLIARAAAPVESAGVRSTDAHPPATHRLAA